MAIRWRVKKLAEARGMNVSQLAEASGMAYSSALDYWHGRARRIDLITLERLCEALAATPSEVLEYLPGVKEEDIESLDLEPAIESAP
jgi:putative transcriptional regulator